MKYTKNFIFFLSFYLIGFTVNAQLTSIVQKTEHAVFDIKCYDEYGTIVGEATGFYIDNKGTGITALHVLADAKYAFIKDQQGVYKRITELTRICEACDMVEFKTSAIRTPTPFITSAKSLPLKGAPLFIIGSPDGFSNSVSTGILSAVRDENNIKTIQTTAPISHGSSGSPLMNTGGEAIGVIAYGSSKGQNLNFAYALDCRKKMEKAAGYILADYFQKDIRFLNQICPTDPFLILHSVEFNDSLTVLNFSYANISIAFADGGFIYENVEDTSKAMYLTNHATGEKLYVLASTLAESVETVEPMRMGETVFFKMYFPPLPDLQAFDLKEGMKGGDWSFSHVMVPSRHDFNVMEIEKFNEDRFDDLFGYIHGKKYKDAMEEIRKLAKKGKENFRMRTAAALTAYAQDDLDGAILNTKVALKYDFMEDRLHADLSILYSEKHEPEKALAEINKAIALNDDYIEYFWMRGNILYAKEKWKDAISDFDHYMNSCRPMNSIIYYYRALAKFNIGDTSACADLEKAKDLAESDREWDKINTEIKKHCKDYKQ